MSDTKYIAVYIFLFLIGLSCSKKSFEGESLSSSTVLEPLLDNLHYWDDLVSPPDGWPNYDGTSDFNNCERFAWTALTQLYPDTTKNYWNYNIYRPVDVLDDYFEALNYNNKQYRFWQDTFSQSLFAYEEDGILCSTIDTAFFQKYLGEPTCFSRSNVLTYTYYIKQPYRIGQCPYIFDQGSPYESFCHNEHFTPCSSLICYFSLQDGQFISARWFGV